MKEQSAATDQSVEAELAAIRAARESERRIAARREQALAAVIESRRREVALAQEEIRRLSGALRDSEARYAAICSSSFWRATAPLRMIVETLRGVGRRPRS